MEEQPKLLDTTRSCSSAFDVKQTREALTSTEGNLEGDQQLNGFQVGKVMFMRMNRDYSMNAHDDTIKIPWQVNVYERSRPNYDIYGGQIEPGEALTIGTQRELWEELDDQSNCEVAKLTMLQTPLGHACLQSNPSSADRIDKIHVWATVGLWSADPSAAPV